MCFRRLLALRKIDVCSHLDAGVALADNRLEDRFNPLGCVRFDLLDVAQLGWVEPGLGQLALELREHGPALVDQGHAGGGKVGNAGCDQVLDASNL